MKYNPYNLPTENVECYNCGGKGIIKRGDDEKHKQ